MFALTAGWNGLGGEGIIQEGELSGAEYIRGGNACTPLLQVVRAAWNLVYQCKMTYYFSSPQHFKVGDRV